MSKIKIIAFLLFAMMVCTLVVYSPRTSSVMAQQPTGSIPTVTGTPQGVVVSVYLNLEQVSVYSGPSTYAYPAIGLLLAGEEVPAYGISEDGNWIQIYYPGVPDSVAWVYGPNVTIKKTGNLPVIKAPSTPLPASTPEINPTLAAAFIVPITPTRLPTFTPPAPLAVATFVDQSLATTRIPMGFLILGFGFIGGLGVIISFLRGR